MKKINDDENNAGSRTAKSVNRKRSRAARFPWLRISFFVIVCGFVALMFTPLPPKIWRHVKPLLKELKTAQSRQSSVEQLKANAAQGHELDPAVMVRPAEHTVKSGGDIRRMSKGFELRTEVTLLDGRSASEERKTAESYTASYELKVNLPKAIETLNELELVSPGISRALPGLEAIFPQAKVSPFYYALYENKVERLKRNAIQLNELMTKHNFYDCETILEMEAPHTKRRILLVQAEMDVVSDGSDGDRMPVMPEEIVNSSHYQPMTSYGWRKRGETPNPLISGWKRRIEKANAEIQRPDTTEVREAWLRVRIKKIQREIEDMEARSYLIADHDPFIVMPINMVTDRNDAYAANIGDYAVVFYQGILLPCIVGDAGPSFKVGEASLRMAKELNAQASSYSRPVSDLAVTYIVFPRSADAFGPPDYGRWREKCGELLEEIGGIGVGSKLHSWRNTLPVIEQEEQQELGE